MTMMSHESRSNLDPASIAVLALVAHEVRTAVVHINRYLLVTATISMVRTCRAVVG
jgi:hypothetical protein